MPRYDHSGGAVPAELQSAMTSGGPVDLSISLSDGWPTTNFFIVVDRGLPNEEKIRVASRSGQVLNVAERGADDTLAQSHSTGAIVEHVFTALEADEANAHIEASESVHGLPVGDSVAGRAYVDQEAAAAEADAKSYADAQDAAQSVSDRAYADAGDAATLSSAQNYADTQDSAHTSAPNPHPQYATPSQVTSAVSTHADTTTSVHGVNDGSNIASEETVDTKITQLFEGDFAGSSMRLVVLKVEITNPGSTFTLAIGQYGFTQRPLAWLTVKKNIYVGDVPYASLGNDPGGINTLNINVVDAKDGSPVSGSVFLDVLMVGPIS